MIVALRAPSFAKFGEVGTVPVSAKRDNPRIQEPRGDSVKLLSYFTFLCFIFYIFVFYILHFCVLYFTFLCFIFYIFVFCILRFYVLYFTFLCFIFYIFMFYILHRNEKLEIQK